MEKKEIYDDQLIVITGAAGFIGSAIVRYLNDRGFTNLLLVDDLKESNKWLNLRGKLFQHFISKHELFQYLKGREKEIEAILHLGACSDTTCRDGDYFMENNYRFSVKLAEYALKNNHRFIYASSAATYGDGKLGFSDSHDLLSDLKPLNIYGYSKHLFDLWLMQQGALDQVVGLKYFNVFGPNEFHKKRMASMVYHMTPKIQSQGYVELFKSTEPEKFKDGEQCRDFIYVKDAAAFTCFFLDYHLNGIFNVGRGEAVSWNRISEAIFKALNLPVDIRYVPMPKDLVEQYQNYTMADLSKFQKSLKKREIERIPLQTIEESVQDYVQNYLIKNETW
ncbi:MAG: ADP-glyceromanno-heptose 6-epimerase [Simkaniaceae bacterium]